MKLVYSGDRLRTFLQRNKITYKEAAERLGIDKNTVGKAVRGGNLNVDSLLLICNEFGFDITDFFKPEGMSPELIDENYYNSSTGVLTEAVECSDVAINYKKCEKSDEEISSLSALFTQSHTLVCELMEKHEECRRILDKLTPEANR